MKNEAYWSWLEEQSDRGEESERAAFSGDSVALMEQPDLTLEPIVPTGFESFWT